VRGQNGGFSLVDADYFRDDRADENLCPSELAPLLHLPVLQLPLTVEGGNILSNGRGICLTTTAFLERNAHRKLSNNEIGRAFKAAYGFEHVVALEPLRLEVTGHIDMFATFTAPDTVVVGQYDPGVDPVNAEVLDRNAAVLAQI